MKNKIVAMPREISIIGANPTVTDEELAQGIKAQQFINRWLANARIIGANPTVTDEELANGVKAQQAKRFMAQETQDLAKNWKSFNETMAKKLATDIKRLGLEGKPSGFYQPRESGKMADMSILNSTDKKDGMREKDSDGKWLATDKAVAYLLSDGETTDIDSLKLDENYIKSVKTLIQDKWQIKPK